MPLTPTFWRPSCFILLALPWSHQDFSTIKTTARDVSFKKTIQTIFKTKQRLTVHLAIFLISGRPFLFAPGHLEGAKIPLTGGSALMQKVSTCNINGFLFYKVRLCQKTLPLHQAVIEPNGGFLDPVFLSVTSKETQGFPVPHSTLCVLDLLIPLPLHYNCSHPRKDFLMS